MLDYKIVVLSRKRSHNMPTIRELLPSALVCVDEREANDYGKHVPDKNLLIHPPIDGAPPVRNWIQDAVNSETLIMCDDDFQGVKCLVGSRRFIDDPEEILAIIENSVQVCTDLDITAFCWSRTVNLTFIDPDTLPIKPVQQVYGCFGMRGAARHRRYDVNLKSRADLDWSLQTLLHDRFVYADMRYYFDFGTSLTGSGGNTGLVRPEMFLESSRIVQERWGKYVSFTGPGWVKNRDITPCTIKVRRSNNSAKK